MIKSDSINELAAALAKAQSELKNPHFDQTNPHFRSKFASLAAVRDAVIPVLAKHGLSLTQWPHNEENRTGCITMLAHASGQFVEQMFLIPTEKSTAHGHASALTYARRLSMQAVAGVVGDEDDDGNEAAGSKPVVKGTITPTTGAVESLPADRQEICKRIADDIASCDDVSMAHDLFYGIPDKDEQIAVWAFLQPNSALRRKIKAHHDQLKGKAA